MLCGWLLQLEGAEYFRIAYLGILPDAFNKAEV